MTRHGRNHGAYHGDRIDPDALHHVIESEARRHGWAIDHCVTDHGLALPVLSRPAHSPDALRCYLSAAIHGDEPAGPLALLDLLRHRLLPDSVHFEIFPLLNPDGLRQNSRFNGSGIDLNRDYNHLQAPETRAHVRWLQSQPPFDLTVLLHEDWESNGFYLYELLPPDGHSLAPQIVHDVSRVCPIEHSELIDGRQAHAPGILHPPVDPAARTDWPEAFWLLQNRSRRNLTLEAPSDFPLATRIAALATGILTALQQVIDAHPRNIT